MNSEHKEIIKKLMNYNSKAISLLENVEETALVSILRFSCLNNKSIIIHDIKKRKSRDAFFCNLINGVKNEHCRSEINRVYKIIIGTEELYDRIKIFIKNSFISRHDVKKQIWSHIKRAESEFRYIYDQTYTDIHKTMTMHDGLTGLYVKGTDGEIAQADIAIEAYIFYLCMYLKMAAYENNLYDINGVVTLPEVVDTDDTSTFEAGSIFVSSIAWLKLEEFSTKALCFGGVYNKLPLSDVINNSDNEFSGNTEGKNVHFFEMNVNEYLLSDLISNVRYGHKKHQNSIEIAFSCQDNGKAIELIGLKDVHEFTSFLFLQNTLFLEQEVFTKEYGGLTLIEWIKGYSELSSYAKSNVNSEILISSKSELIRIIDNRIKSKKKTCLLIDYLTFNKKSQDLFDSPLVRIKGDKYYVCKPSLISISLDEAILSTFSTWDIKIDKKGYKFEDHVNSSIKVLGSELGIKCEKFKVRINNEEYDYDCIFVFDDKVFILECKNRTPTKNIIVNIINKQSDLLSYIKQVKRLEDALIKNPSIFKKKFGGDITKFEVIPIVFYNHPFTYPKTSDGVYITDSSIFFRFFKMPYISMEILRGEQKEVIYKSDSFWSGEKPTADDLIKYIDSPPQVKMFIGNIKTDKRPYPIDEDNIFSGNDIVISNFLKDKNNVSNTN